MYYSNLGNKMNEIEYLKKLLQQCIHHLKEHNLEYGHYTPDKLILLVKEAIENNGEIKTYTVKYDVHRPSNETFDYRNQLTSIDAVSAEAAMIKFNTEYPSANGDYYTVTDIWLRN